jgi:hypothetical protein
MSFTFIVVLRARKRLTPKDVTAVKGLRHGLHQNGDDKRRFSGRLYPPKLCGELLHVVHILFAGPLLSPGLMAFFFILPLSH